MKLMNKKKQFLKNSLFNTLNLCRKKILKTQLSQYYVKKNYGNFYSGNYSSIYNNLFDKNTQNYYQNSNLKTAIQDLNFLERNFRRLLFIFKFLIRKLKEYSSIFIKKKKFEIKQKKIIFQTLFDYSNQMSFVPLTKKLKNKDYYVLIKTLDKKSIKFFKELYGNKNVINAHEYGALKDILKSISFIIEDFSKILTFRKIFKLHNENIIKFFFTIFENYYLYLIYSKIFKKINPKKSVIMSSIQNEMFIAALKDVSKASLYAYAVQGVSFTCQSPTSQFLFNSVDKLFCYGNSDYKHFKNIASDKNFILAKKIIISGSVRDYYFSKKKKKLDKINQKIKILYLRSNEVWFGNLDTFYLKKFSKIIKSNFEKNLIYTIKERENSYTAASKNLIKENIIKKSKIIINKKLLTEKIISESDIIVGTISTSILYQSLYFNKLIIQLGAKNLPWANNLNECGILCAENDSQIFEILSNLLTKKNFYKKQLNKQKLLSKYLITKKNSINLITNELKKN